MADIRLVGAVAVKVRPDARGFRGDTKKAVLSELNGVDFDVKVDVDADTSKVKTKAERAVKDAEAKSINLKYGLNYESLRKTIKQVETEMNNLTLESMQVQLDQESLEKAHEELSGLADISDIEMTYVPDEKGYQAVLAKIRAIQRERTEKEITFSADKESLEDMAEEFEEKLAALAPGKQIQLDVQTNRSSLAKSLQQVEDQLTAFRKIPLNVDLNEESLNAAKEMLEEELSETPHDIKLNWDSQDSLKAAKKELQKMLDDKSMSTLEVNADKESMRKALDDIDGLIEDAEDKPVDVRVQAAPGTLETTAAQLMYATRARRVPFFVTVDKKSLAIAEGLLQSLAGLNTLRGIGRRLENLIVDFDTIALKSGAWSTAIGGIVDTLGYMLTATLSIGDGMAEVVGLLATAPAAFATLASAILINVAAFEDFKSAIDGDAEALARLPENARNAALALQGTWDMIQEPVQEAFWEGMGDSMQTAVNAFIPVLRDGLTDASSHVGEFAAGFMRSMQVIAENGDLEKMFTGLEGFFDNAAGAAEPLFDALNTLGLRGSEYLPDMGQWLTDIAKGFDDWIQAADEAGDINRWIEDGVQSLQDMGGATLALIDQIRALAGAANLAGAGGLSEFRDNMREIADMMLSEPFQSQMSEIFTGARKGASALSDGVSTLGRELGQSSDFVADLLYQLGLLGGDVLKGVTDLFDERKFQGGISDALAGLIEMVDELEPSFDGLGRVIGGFGSLAGEVFRNLAPLINTVVGMLDDTLATLGPAFEDLVGPLTGIIETMLMATHGPLMAFATMAAGITEAITAWPAPLRDAALALGGLLLMRRQIGGFVGALRKPIGGFKTLGTVIAGTSSTGTRHMRLLQRNGSKSVQLLQRNVNGFSGRKMVASVSGMTSRSSKLMGGMGRAASGALGLMGGPAGLAIMAGVTIFTLASAQSQKAKAEIDKIAGSLEETTGALTDSTRDIIADQLMTEESFLWWEKSSAVDAVKNMGGSLDVLQEAAEGVPASIDAVNRSIALAFEDLSGPQQAVDTFARSLDVMAEAGSGMGAGFMEWVSDFFQSDGARVGEEMQGQATKMELAQQRVAEKAKLLGTSTGGAYKMVEAFDTMSESASTASQRVSAVRTMLDRLKGGTLSAQEAAREFARSFEDANTQLAQLAKDNGGSLDHLVRMDGTIKSLKGAGGELYDAVSGVTDSMLQQSQSAYQAAMDAGKGAEVAGNKAVAALQLSEGELSTMAQNMGIDVGTLKLILDNFFASDWKMKAIMGADAELFFDEKAKAEAAGEVFDKEYWEAVLDANETKAEKAIAEAKANGTQFDLDLFRSTLDADSMPFNNSVVAGKLLGQDFGNDKWTSGLDANPAPFESTLLSSIARGLLFDQDTFTATGDLNKNPFDTTLGLANLSGVNFGDNRFVPTADLFKDPFDTGVSNAFNTGTGFDDENFRATASVNDQASSVLGTIWDTLTSIGGSVWTATVDLFTSGGDNNADGNLYNSPGRPQKFAGGGFSSPKLERPGQAKIYSPLSRHRIFAEPVTGGEAYIPMSMNKRTRSTRILDEVARKFGYELTKSGAGSALSGGKSKGGQFADGGFDGIHRPSAPQKTDNAPVNVTINGTPVNYAQETANTVLFALRHARGGTPGGA